MKESWSLRARALIGIGLALAGVAIVELLLALGVPILGPVGYPGLGMVVAAALAGTIGAAAGAAVTMAYYAASFAAPERFPAFFSSTYLSVVWIFAFGAMTALVLFFRTRWHRAEFAATLERALRESEQRLRVIADNIPALVAYLDRRERYRFNNKVYEEWLGRSAEELVARSAREVWGEERYAMMKPAIDRAMAGERVAIEYAIPDRGVERRVLATYVPDLDEAGRVRGLFFLGSDITQLAYARAELAAARERLEEALQGSSVATWDTDLVTGKVYLSEAWAGIIGLPRKSSVVTLAELVALLHPDDLDELRRAAVETMKGLRASYAVEHRVRASSGEWKWILSRGRVTQRDENGRAQRMIGTNIDITERKRVEEALQSAAHSDPLTGLCNRAALADRLRQAIARAERGRTPLAVLFLDIDRFKQVNDTHGHAAGDAILRSFAARLRDCVRGSDTVARLGGDEFVVVLEELKHPDDASRVAGKIVEAMRRPLVSAGQTVTVSTSVGVALWTEGEGADALLRRADEALYAAKRGGRDTVRGAA